jgi:Rrf2 family protein
MFSFTTKSVYGLNAALYLARCYGSGLAQVKDIAERHGIPVPYLVQILNLLVHAGLVRAVRGQQGGYELARHPKTITLLEVLEVLEGPLELSRSRQDEDAVKDIYMEVEAAVRKGMGVSLADILARQGQKNEAIYFEI